jgi:plasmid segregation protein ParM
MNLGLDVGYGDVKAVYQREGILEMLKFPTAIAYGEREVGDLSAFAGGEEYEYRGRKYLVGREALFGAFSTRSFEFMKRYSPLFVFKAVKKIHRKTGELVTDVAMGLPLSHYTDVNLKELVPLLQRIEVGREVLELNARFYPQGLGVLADYRLSQAGDINARTNHDMIILDIGFNTVDIIVVERGRIVKGESDTLERHGVSKISLDLAKEIKVRMQLDLSEQESKDVLRQGRIRVYGAERDLSELVRDSAEKYMDWLIQEVRSKWTARIQRAEKVIIAGGGAYYLQEHIPEEYLPLVHVPDRPEYANARGFLKALDVESRK